MSRLITTVLAALAFASIPIGASATAAELVFVELRSCIYCIKFNREMAPAYEASELGKRVPLRRVSPRKWPTDLMGVERPPYTPVFILVENGSEIGRFLGYSGPEHFNRELGKLLGRK